MLTNNTQFTSKVNPIIFPNGIWIYGISYIKKNHNHNHNHNLFLTKKKQPVSASHLMFQIEQKRYISAITRHEKEAEVTFEVKVRSYHSLRDQTEALEASARHFKNNTALHELIKQRELWTHLILADIKVVPMNPRLRDFVPLLALRKHALI